LSTTADWEDDLHFLSPQILQIRDSAQLYSFINNYVNSLIFNYSFILEKNIQTWEWSCSRYTVCYCYAIRDRVCVKLFLIFLQILTKVWFMQMCGFSCSNISP